jgi:hypothetical protein
MRREKTELLKYYHENIKTELLNFETSYKKEKQEANYG